MVLEFLTEEDASSAFNFNSEGFDRFKSHPLFDSIEVKKYARPLLPRYTTYRDSDSFNIYIFYYSGLEKRKVVRRIEIRRYKNILRLIPEELKYEWITKEIIIAMYIANMVTPDNLNIANEVFKSNLKDYVDIISKALNK